MARPPLPTGYRVDPTENPVVVRSDETTGISYGRRRTPRRRQTLVVRFPQLRQAGKKAVREHYNGYGGGLVFELDTKGRGPVFVIYSSPPVFTPTGPKHWACTFTVEESFH